MKIPTRSVALAALLAMTLGVTVAQGPSDDEADRTQTRRAEAVRVAVHKKILQAQEASQADDFPTAISILTTMLADDELSGYERSIVNENLGYAHNAAGDVSSAILAFEAVLRTPGLDPRTDKRIRYILAQLCTVDERYAAALRYIDGWFGLETAPRPDGFILRAQILYHLERYRDMIEPIETALALAEMQNVDTKESWYALLAFGYFHVENYVGIRDVNKILLERWPKKQYWQYLANAFRELDDDARLLVAYDVLYLQGLLRSDTELITLAQLYLQHGLPFEAGVVLAGAMDDGLVPRTVANLKLLSQAWSLAQENERAIVPLEKAAALDDDGELYIRLANNLLGLGRHQECADAARRGIDKGIERSPDHADITLGICLYNLQDYAAARRAFRSAARAQRSKTAAWQWIRAIDDELKRLRHINEAEALARARRADLEARQAL